ncbi:hypothetical protein CIW49_25670 [Mycolicibacterium sp. P1-18]|nr:hypothetical protein CIW49_25670 [Mycolicibacterium sp. P1-18]
MASPRAGRTFVGPVDASLAEVVIPTDRVAPTTAVGGEWRTCATFVVPDLPDVDVAGSSTAVVDEAVAAGPPAAASPVDVEVDECVCGPAPEPSEVAPSACATAEPLATATPMPSATASAPTRPT